MEGGKGTGPRRSQSSRGMGSAQELVKVLEVAGGWRAGRREGEALGCGSHEAAVCRLKPGQQRQRETKSSKRERLSRSSGRVNTERERLNERCEAVLGGSAEVKSLKGVGSGARHEDFQLSSN